VSSTLPVNLRRIDYKASSENIGRVLAVEAPVAFEYNGFAYAVMMATPADLEAFAIGFTLSERLVAGRADILSLDIAPVEQGHIIRIALSPERANAIRDRVRLRVGEGSCGLCGIESIGQALRPIPRVDAPLAVTRRAIANALGDLAKHQPLGQETGAMHAAAFCAANGTIIAAIEDVGRHSALDKLLGALSLRAVSPCNGFLLLTARCSYELVEKAAVAGCPVLVTISAPTSLAADRAESANISLVALARGDSALVVTDLAGRII
jgi:FdhD protein